MSTVHYCHWNPPISHPERFAQWSSDVRKLLDYLPHYVAAGRKQRLSILRREDIQLGVSYTVWDLEEYDEQKHGDKSQYMRFALGPGGTTPLHITGPDCVGEPLITPNQIAFGGRLTYFLEEDVWGEPFELSVEELLHGNAVLHTGFKGWKTAGADHDLLATAALIRLLVHFPEIEISSDAGAPGFWEATVLCKEVFGVGVNPLIEEVDPLLDEEENLPDVSRTRDGRDIDS